MNEIVFVINESPDGGFEARALEASIHTQADTVDELRKMVKDAVRCHFDEGGSPKIILKRFVQPGF